VDSSQLTGQPRHGTLGVEGDALSRGLLYPYEANHAVGEMAVAAQDGDAVPSAHAEIGQGPAQPVAPAVQRANRRLSRPQLGLMSDQVAEQLEL